MNAVFIKGLEVDTVIGTYDWERTIRQYLRLDLCLGWDNRPATAGDELSKSLNYTAVSAHVQGFASEAQFILVEPFAEWQSRC